MTERATELGADAMLSVTPYYNQPNRRGLRRHYEEVARATDRPILLYNIPSRVVLDLPNDLLAELAQIEHIDGVKQANNDNLALIDGLELYAGNDDIFARTLDLGGAGGILVASHVVGDEMRRMVDEPDQRAEIDARLQDVYAGAGRHHQPDPGQGRAEPARPPRRRAAPAARRGRRGRAAPPSAPCSSATACCRLPEPSWPTASCASCRSAAWARSART